MKSIETWYDFARVTVQTKDLDPTYDFLWNARQEMGDNWADRFALHMLMFYDLGGAVAAAQQTNEHNFWEYVLDNYTAFPRGTERRHSRGTLGLGYVTELSKRGSPTKLLGKMTGEYYTYLVKTVERDFKGCGFGPYFIWKVLDYQERCLGRAIYLTLDECLKYMPAEPRKCAATLWPHTSLRVVVDGVRKAIYNLPAPGSPDRLCSYQEVETVLCMLKGYFITKTHTIGDDIDEKHEQLRKWPEFLKFLPPKQDWSQYVRVDSPSVSASVA